MLETKLKHFCWAVCAVLIFSACDRKRPVLLQVAGSGTSGVTLRCPQVENHIFPECRAFVLVQDQAGNVLTDFKIGNFTVLENGGPTVVTKVGKVSEPLSVSIVLDRSGSMFGAATTDVNAAATQFIDLLGANDQAEIIDFNHEVKVSQSFTSDKVALKTAINAASAGGNTAFYDAISLAAGELKRQSGRKFILSMTDGLDNSSTNTELTAADNINKGGVCAYIIGLGVGLDPSILRTIADSTQGQYVSSPASSQLAAHFTNIFNLMQNLVEVSFRSRNSDTVKDIGVYLNYGTVSASATRRYGY